MSLLSEIERRAWDSRGSSDDHKPVMALKAALDDVASAKRNPMHVWIVLWGDAEDENSQDFSYYQAGSLSTIAVEGAIARVLRSHQDETA